MDEDPKLTDSCYKCYGRGVYLDQKCSKCNGTGREITEFGYKLLQFLTNHTRIDQIEEIEERLKNLEQKPLQLNSKATDF